MSAISNRNDWVFNKIDNILDDKQATLRSIIVQMLNKTTKIFKYNNLPDTILTKDLETQLQVGGFAIFKEVKGNLYTFIGGLGGEPNPYYLPTKAVIANPALRYNAELEINTECVVMLNDHYYQGMMPLFNRYGNLLLEAELSLRNAIINARVPAIIQADNDTTYKSALEFFQKIKEGKDYGIVMSKEMFDGLKLQDFYKNNYIKELIESIQYIKGSWFNEIGLNAAFNMKREAINEAEATLNEDILYPTIDTMLDCRNDALEKVNKMYGTNITVELNSIWGRNRKTDDVALDYEEAEVDVLVNEANSIDVEEEKDNEIDRDSNSETDN